VACILRSGGAGVTFLAMYTGGREGPFWDKYQKVQLGMTEEEVEDILGPPRYEEYTGGSNGPRVCIWVEGEQRIGVAFDFGTKFPFGPSVVVKKGFLPYSVREKLRQLLTRSTPDWP